MIFIQLLLLFYFANAELMLKLLKLILQIMLTLIVMLLTEANAETIAEAEDDA